MDRLESIETLLAAVDGGSFSAASRALGTPLSTVSRRVSELEAHLGARLLTRSSRRLSLTEAGAAYVSVCRRVIDELSDAERIVAGEYRAPRGQLTITAPIVFGRVHVEPILLEFLKVYPDITARLVLTDRVSHFVEDHVDAAIRVGRLPDSSLIATRLGTIRWVTCASPAYLAARGVPQTPEDLAAHHCVTFEGADFSNTWTFGAGGGAPPIYPRLAVNTAEAAIDAAIASTGITRVLSYQIAEAVRAGALVRVLTAFEPEPLPLHLVYAERPFLPQKLRAFLDFVSPRLKAALEGSIY